MENAPTPSLALSVRFKSRPESSAKNDIRHELRRGPQPAYIDGSRTGLNTVIVKPQSPAVLRDLCAERRALLPMQRKAKATDAISLSSIITFGTGLQPHVEALGQERQDQLYEAVARAVADHIGIEVTGLVAHRDEVGQHAHGQHPGRHPSGLPISKVITRKVASEIQTIAMEAARPFLPMIERGKKKSDRIKNGEPASAIYNRSVRQLHDDFPREIEARRQELVVAEARVIEMEARVAKLREKEELTVKEQKRLETYKKRLTDREAQLEEACRLVEEQQRVQAETAAELKSDREELEQEAILQIEDRMDLTSDAADLAEAKKEIERQRRELEVVRTEVEQLRDKLRHVGKIVASWVGEVADHLGVGRKVREIDEVIRSAGIDIGSDDDRPSM